MCLPTHIPRLKHTLESFLLSDARFWRGRVCHEVLKILGLLSKHLDVGNLDSNNIVCLWDYVGLIYIHFLEACVPRLLCSSVA
jgi:hypothetical protein